MRPYERTNMNFYALAILSQTAIDQAIQLGLNPDSYSYKTLTDTRRDGGYLYVAVENDSVLWARPLKTDEIEFLDRVDVTVIK